MSARHVLFITHADVAIDPRVPVPEWRLSERGKWRHHLFNTSATVAGMTAIYRSGERKAIEAAEILAGAVHVAPCAIEELHENDRSATGFLPREEFEATAELFFAHPEQSIRGWECAVDARSRIVAAVRSIIAADETTGHIAIVAHGGVGALLLSHILGAPISREYDQPGNGGGNYFAFAADDWCLIHGWRDIAPGLE